LREFELRVIEKGKHEAIVLKTGSLAQMVAAKKAILENESEKSKYDYIWTTPEPAKKEGVKK